MEAVKKKNIKKKLGRVLLYSCFFILVFFRGDVWFSDITQTIYDFRILSFNVVELIVLIGIFYLFLEKIQYLGMPTFKKGFLNTWLVLFICSMFLSIVVGIIYGPGTARLTDGWRILGFGILFYYFYINFFSHDDILDIVKIFLTLSFIKSLIGLWEYLQGRGSIDLSYGYAVFTDGGWLMILGLSVTLGFAIFMINERLTRSERFFFIGTTLIIFITVLLSMRRTPWISMFLGLGAVLFFSNKTYRKYFFLITMVVIIATTTIVYSFVPDQYIELFAARLQSLDPTELSTTRSAFGNFSSTNKSHLEEIEYGLKIALERPVIGYGFATTNLGLYGTRLVWRGMVHNQLLHLWIKMGIAGLCSFIVLCFFTIKQSIAAIVRNKNFTLQTSLATGFLCGLLGELFITSTVAPSHFILYSKCFTFFFIIANLDLLLQFFQQPQQPTPS